MFEATDANDLEVAMVVLHGGTHIDRDEESSKNPAPTCLDYTTHKNTQ